MDGWLDGWMDRNIRMVADAMKLTALVGQVDVKSNRNRWWTDRKRERKGTKERQTERRFKTKTVWPVTWGGRMKKIHNSANMRGLETV